MFLDTKPRVEEVRLGVFLRRLKILSLLRSLQKPGKEDRRLVYLEAGCPAIALLQVATADDLEGPDQDASGADRLRRCRTGRHSGLLPPLRSCCARRRCRPAPGCRFVGTGPRWSCVQAGSIYDTQLSFSTGLAYRIAVHPLRWFGLPASLVQRIALPSHFGGGINQGMK